MVDKFVRVGVGVIIKKDNKVLIGTRKNAHGEGTYSLPGGHLEFNEKVEDCAIRETMEEVGITIKNIEMASFTNDMFVKEDKHYITLFVTCDYDEGEVRVMEPDKCEGWQWVEWDKTPEPLFIPLQHLIEQKYNPFM
jgi:8-oxo-dGTP diphosphatase